jgi:hypothetical protein
VPDRRGWTVRIIDVLDRIRGEFQELPGLRLTHVEARRLWELDPLLCGALLEALVDAQILAKTADGAFVRLQKGVKRR